MIFNAHNRTSGDAANSLLSKHRRMHPLIQANRGRFHPRLVPYIRFHKRINQLSPTFHQSGIQLPDSKMI